MQGHREANRHRLGVTLWQDKPYSVQRQSTTGIVGGSTRPASSRFGWAIYHILCRDDYKKLSKVD